MDRLRKLDQADRVESLHFNDHVVCAHEVHPIGNWQLLASVGDWQSHLGSCVDATTTKLYLQRALVHGLQKPAAELKCLKSFYPQMTQMTQIPDRARGAPGSPGAMPRVRDGL